MAYYILFSANNRIYKQNTHVHTQGRAENSLFQFCLTITKPFSPFFLEEMKKKKIKLHNRPYISRVVICVSRAFCSTDQERRETARSLVIQGHCLPVSFSR